MSRDPGSPRSSEYHAVPAEDGEPQAAPPPDQKESGFIAWHGGSMLLLVLLGTFLNMEYSILMPTVYEYIQSIGGSRILLGWVIASFSISRILFVGLTGLWTDRRPMREVFVATCLLGVVGNALYGLGGKLKSPWVLIAGRFVSGIGATNAVTSRAYLTRVTTSRARTTAIAVSNGIQFLGVMAGPALNFMFTKIDLRIGSWVEVNELTAAGWFMVLPNLISLVGFLTIFKEPPAPEHREHLSAKAMDGSSSHQPFEMKERHRIFWRDGGWWCLFTAFMTTFNLSALETGITPITQTHFHWGTMQNSYLFSGLAVAALAAIVFTVALGKRGRLDREIMVYGILSLITSLVVEVVGCGDGVHVSLAATIGGGILLAFGLIAVSNPNASLFTKIIGEHNQGVFGSAQFLLTAGGRCLGPLAAGLCLDPAFASTYYPFYGLLLGLTVISAVSMLVLWPTFGRVDAEAKARYRRASTHMKEGGTDDLGHSVAVAAAVLGGETEEQALLVEPPDEDSLLDTET